MALHVVCGGDEWFSVTQTLELVPGKNWFESLQEDRYDRCAGGIAFDFVQIAFFLRFFAFVSNFVIFCPLKCLKAWLDVSHGSCVGFDTSLMVSEWRSHKMCPFKDVHCIFPLQKQAFLFPSRKQADISFPPRFFTLFGRPFAMPAWCTSESSTNCALLCSDVGSKPDSLP